jgi:hypothetical protein
MNRNRGSALVTLVLVAVALGGCSEPSHGTEGASCAWVLHYGGKVYQPAPGMDTAKVVPHEGSPIGQGWFDGCQDGGGPEARDTVDVYPVTGVDPALAVITGDDIIGVTDSAHLPAALALPSS